MFDDGDSDVANPIDPGPSSSDPGPSSCNASSNAVRTQNQQFDFPPAQLKFLLEINQDNADAVGDALLEDLSLPFLHRALKSFFIDIYNVRRLQLEEYGDPGRLAEEAILFYKSIRFSRHAEVCISIADQPAVDAGVRRQFMSDVFSYF